jgi:hypothetical protein
MLAHLGIISTEGGIIYVCTYLFDYRLRLLLGAICTASPYCRPEGRARRLQMRPRPVYARDAELVVSAKGIFAIADNDAGV